MADKRLVNYVKTHKRRGYEDHEIKRTLADAGWHQDYIHEAFEATKHNGLAAVVVGLVVVVACSLFIFTPGSPFGYAVYKDNANPLGVECVKSGATDNFLGINDMDSCCFLIENAELCKGPTEGAAVALRQLTGETGTYYYMYGCFGGSTGKVLFTDRAKTYCGLDI